MRNKGQDIDPQLLSSRAGRFFYKVTGHPGLILGLSLILWISCGIFLLTLMLETDMESFIPPDHPAVKLRKQVKDTFGLSDPLVIAVVNERSNGVFNPHTLELVSRLTDEVSRIPGIDPERITSLSTEKNIFGTEDGMEVEPFFDSPPETQTECNEIRKAVMNFPLYTGSLVSRDGAATLIVAELLDEDKDDSAYNAMETLIESMPVQDEKLYVAGDAAVSVYFGKYVFMDSVRMTPAVFLVVSLIMLIAYRKLRGILVPNLVVMAAVGTALGIMAALKVPFYNITNALPVLLVAIGVADGIHIMGEYYEQAANRQSESQRGLIVRTMINMWRPVTITSMTDIAGFMALSLSSFMPPMRAFGIYASIGVLAAWLFSVLSIPAGLMFVEKQESLAFRKDRDDEGVSSDRFGGSMARLGAFLNRRPGWSLILVGLVILAGTGGALNLRVDDNRVENFQKDEPIYLADRVINEKLDGTVYMDVVVDASAPEGMFQTSNLLRVEALEAFLNEQPQVKNVTSILDHLKQMNRAMNANKPEMYRLPDNSDTVAQYFLLYSAISSPIDFEQFVDYDYRKANLRVAMSSGWYSDFKGVVNKVEQYINQTFNTSGLSAQLAGRVDVDYHWLGDVARSHFRGLLLSFLAVWLMVSFFFRSFSAGLLGLIPISLAVLLVYAWMGVSGMALDISTSMFAAISIGCGVDFAVHLLDRLMELTRRDGVSIDEAFSVLFPSTGRALLFNFFAIFFGFTVLTISQVPAIARFGVLVCVAVFASFAASLIVLPSLIKVFQPAFLIPKSEGTTQERHEH